MSHLYQAIAEEYLFWIIAGCGAVYALLQYAKTKSWGQTFSVFLVGLVLSWAVVSIPVLRGIVGGALLWLLGFLPFG